MSPAAEPALAAEFLEALDRALERAAARAAADVQGAPPGAPHDPFADRAQAALEQRLEEMDDDPLCTVRSLDRPRPLSDRVTVTGNVLRGGEMQPAPVTDFGCLLLAAGLLRVEDIEQAIERVRRKVTAEGLARAVVHRHLADGDLEAATAAVEHPGLAERTYLGWRAIGEHHARHGDTAAFLALWPRYDTRREKTWVEEVRRLLIEQVSRREGWRSGLALSQRPKVSTPSSRGSLARVALGPLADSVREPELRELFATAPELADVEELDRLDLRVRSVRAHNEDREAGADHPALRPLLEEIIALDPSAAKHVMRVRDRMLTDLWPVIGQARTLADLRAAVRTPALKRELMVLHDDVVPGEPPC